MCTVLMSGYCNGNKETWIFYSLIRATMFDGTSVYGIIRDYGDSIDGTPDNSVSLVCVDDGTDESFYKAYRLFQMYID